MKIEDGIDRFLSDRASFCAKKTMDFYGEGLSYFDSWCKDNNIIDIEDIKETSIIDYQIYLRGKTGRNRSGILKNTTINTYMRSVRTLFNFLRDDEKLDKKVKMPKRLKDDADQVFVLTASEVKNVDDEIFNSAFGSKRKTKEKTILYNRNMLIFHLLLDGALRMSEVVNLTKGSIDLEKRIIYVNKGKGRKDRIIPMAGILEKYFKQLYEYYSYDEMSNDVLFYTVDMEHSITIDTVKQFFAKLKKRVCMDRLHPHILRHTFATSFIMSGGDVSVLKVLLGHSDIMITQRYLHLAAQFTISKLDIYKLDPVFFDS